MYSFVMNQLNVDITTSDAVIIKVEIFGENNQNVLIINPAIGVKRKMYYAFAEFLAKNGVTAILYNYRGMEDGMNGIAKSTVCDIESWGRLDQFAVIAWVSEKLKPKKLQLLGHSIGGQLLGFTENSNLIDGLILVAAQKGDKRLWPVSGYVKLFILWHILIPLMSKGKTFNPKKLGLGSYIWPSAAAYQWASWGQQKNYLFNPKFGFDLSHWHNFNKPLISYGFTDDNLAPEAAIESLIKEFGNDSKHNKDKNFYDKHMVSPESLGVRSIGHFGFFKPKANKLWQDLLKWIETN